MNIVSSLTADELLEVARISALCPGGERWPLQEIQSEFAAARTLAWREDGQVMAFVFYRELADALEVTWLATEPKKRRQGLMSKLLVEIFDANRQTHEVWLEVRADNLPARNLYQKLGFMATRQRKGYYSDGADAIVMTLHRP